MHQENLWATAPRRTAITFATGYVPSQDHWYLSFMFHQSKGEDTAVARSITMSVENDEMDVVPYLYATAFRMWDNGEEYHRTERAVKQHLDSYRKTGISCPGHMSGFRSVSFH